MTPPRVVYLTPMQRRVLGELTRDGASNAVIAARLHLSIDTVKVHLKGISRAMDVRGRAAVVALCLRGEVVVRIVTQPSRVAS